LSVTLPQVADLCVAKFADYCAVVAQHGDGGLSLVEAARRPGFHVAAQDAETFRHILQERGFETIVVAPLVGRQETLGIFVIAARHKSAFNGQTQKLAKVLALQIANALDQSLLFERTHRVADRLQRALLPDSLPHIPGAAFHAAYRPASDEAEVGGDWYDAFKLPDGRIAISMGDVAGHGLEAATVMGEIRQSMRTAAVTQRTPAQLLEHINSVINLRKSIGMVTAIFAFYEPRSRQLTYAVAGHPPPVLTISGGFNGFLPGGGVPLGVESEIRAADWTIVLPPRSCVVFYTDGMTEYSRDVLLGEHRLIEASARSFESDPENPALALQERIFDATVNRDDAATLTLSCHDGTIPESMTLSAIPLAAPIVRSMLHRLCDQYEIDEERRFSIITAAGEAVANAVEHAYRDEEPGQVQVRFFVDATTVQIEIEDYGRWRPFQRREERGRGIVLMHELMDRVRIISEQSRTVISLTATR
jgi:serine phosphatase RsbU (regulator of sigma subunit)/anti-sigma regulatory factor (Ser/Thr protein kinase)